MAETKTTGPTSGETNLKNLLSGLTAKKDDRLFVFACVPHDQWDEIDEAVKQAAQMTFIEAEGISLIIPQEVAMAHQIESVYPSRMITLTIHSALDAVGFLAHITTALAKEGVSVNAVAGYFHDHLFVPDAAADKVMAVLADIAKSQG